MEETSNNGKKLFLKNDINLSSKITKKDKRKVLRMAQRITKKNRIKLRNRGVAVVSITNIPVKKKRYSYGIRG